MRIAIYDRWLATLGGGEKLCLSVAKHLSRQHDVTFFSASAVPRDLIGARLNLYPDQVRFETISSRDLPHITLGFDVFINGSQGDFIPTRAARSVMLVYFPVPIQYDAGAKARAMVGKWVKRMLAVPPLAEPAGASLTSQARYKLFHSLFESSHSDLGARLRAAPDDVDALPHILAQYQHVWSISAFTAQWVKTYWQRDSEVLTPVVDVSSFVAGVKQPCILSVGRFFAGNHNKKHLEMVRVFRELVADGLSGWELHLAGNTLPQAEHQAYLQRVMDAAAGLPVHIHADCALEALKSLYACSAIYWHAAGYGEDESREPIKAEHFGISTVESMAAGCVPVVIRRGGQPEIVQHEHNGLLWDTLDQLKMNTRRLIENDMLRQQLSSQAQADSRRYDWAQFTTQLDALMNRVEA